LNASPKLQTIVIFSMVFFGGFANLATEIIGPRMFASMYGTATSIWAIIISVTLVGLSVGYAIGGRISPEKVPDVLPMILIANAGWLLLVSWIIWMLPSGGGGASFNAVTTTAMLAFFPPSVLFGMLTPMSITLLSQNQASDDIGPIVGNLYALSTFGSVLGALSAAYIWIPWVGLSLSLRIFAAALVGFAIYFWRDRPVILGVAALAVVVVPQPGWAWASMDDLTLVEQREGYYQTIRVYTDGDHMQMHLGPTFHSKIDLETGQPVYSYAQNLLTLADAHAPDMTGQRVLIIGGAGNALATAFETRGAETVTVEIDPIVVQLSNEHFRPVDGDIIVADGRSYIENVPENHFDMIVLDAFDGGAGVPPQLSTIEYYAATQRALKPGGLFLYNFIGTPEGPRAASYTATAATIDAVFPSAGALFTRENVTERQNIIFAASPTDTRLPSGLSPLTDQGPRLTDDRNPIEILNEQSRGGIYFQR
jgi:spermidine synthase